MTNHSFHPFATSFNWMGFFLKVQMYSLGKVVEWGEKLLAGKGGGVG